ncbi:MAG: transposase [Gemmatimonadales bacterium]
MKASLVFLDESAVLMSPLVRRTWQRRGCTPVLYERHRAHKKITIIAALCVPPSRERVHLYFQLHPERNINAERVLDFLCHLLKQLRTPTIVLWDRLQAHRDRGVQEFIEFFPGLEAHFFPPYAPELNPAEYLWAYLKTNPLANFALYDLETLASTTRRCAWSVQKTQSLLCSFINHSPLSLRLK